MENQAIIKNENENNLQIDNVEEKENNNDDQTKIIVKNKKKKRKLSFSKWRLVLNFWTIWRTIAKAKKVTRRIKNDPNSYTEEWRYIWLRKKAIKLIKIIGATVDVIGIENWLDRGVVLAPNHQSGLDPILMLALNDFSKQQPIAFIAKQELWKAKGFKHFMNLIDNVPLDRKSPRSALNAMKEAKELISEYKRSLVIFPEGTRSASQQVNEFLPASMKVAQMSYVPIIPVSIINSYRLYKQENKEKMNIIVVFGKPIMPEKFISLKTEMLTRNVQKEVMKNIEKYKDWDPKKLDIKPKAINKKAKIRYY